MFYTRDVGELEQRALESFRLENLGPAVPPRSLSPSATSTPLTDSIPRLAMKKICFSVEKTSPECLLLLGVVGLLRGLLPPAFGAPCGV